MPKAPFKVRIAEWRSESIEPCLEKQQRNRLALRLSLRDTRIFSLAVDVFWLYLSVSYWGARCPICITVHNGAQLIHANFTHKLSRRKSMF